jgi:hypothetical protein
MPIDDCSPMIETDHDDMVDGGNNWLSDGWWLRIDNNDWWHMQNDCPFNGMWHRVGNWLVSCVV